MLVRLSTVNFALRACVARAGSSRPAITRKVYLKKSAPRMAARLPPSSPLPQRFRTSSEAFRTSSALLPHFCRTSAALLLPHFFRSGSIERHLTSSGLLPHFIQKTMFYLPYYLLVLVFQRQRTTQQQINSFALPICCHLEETRPPPVHSNRLPAVWCRAHTRRAAVLR